MHIPMKTSTVASVGNGMTCIDDEAVVRHSHKRCVRCPFDPPSVTSHATSATVRRFEWPPALSSQRDAASHCVESTWNHSC